MARKSLLVIIISLAARGHAGDREPSHLRYTPPEGWRRAFDPATLLTTLTAPDGMASAIFAVSEDFTGTAQEWQEHLWSGLLEHLKLATPAVSGVQGKFLTRMGMFNLPNGTQPRVCLFSLVKNGRGEAVIFRAVDDQQFLAHLFAANQIIDGIKVANDSSNQSTDATRESAQTAGQSPGIATGTPALRNSSAVRSTTSRPVDSIPVLNYDEPANFYRGAGFSPIEYSSTEVNCSMQVYDFRPCSQNVREMFQKTLLRDWIDRRYEQGQLVAQPVFSTLSVPGADAVVTARFHQSIVGLPDERMRILIVVGSRAAVVDVVANNAFCWQKAFPSVNAMLASLRVGTKQAPPSLSEGPGQVGAALAGLYRGNKSKYMVDFSRPVGQGHFVMAPHYYLFSADGRVFRCYDFPPGSNGDWQNFDFDTARRNDPVNTGRYTVRDNQLFIQFNDRSSGMITSTIGDPTAVEIETVKYARQ